MFIFLQCSFIALYLMVVNKGRFKILKFQAKLPILARGHLYFERWMTILTRKCENCYQQTTVRIHWHVFFAVIGRALALVRFLIG